MCNATSVFGRYYFGIGGGSLPFVKFVRDAEEMRRQARLEKKKKRDQESPQRNDGSRQKETRGCVPHEEVEETMGMDEKTIEREHETHWAGEEIEGEEEEDDLEIEVVHTIQDKVSNVRDILLLRKKSHVPLPS